MSAQTAPQLVPYTSRLIAGGGTAIAKGATCPVSGNISTDAYGDGCLATEVQLSSPRYAVADAAGNIFFSDYTASLIRRVDVTTGVVSLIAGGVTTSPATGTACGANLSLDNKGDGCLATMVNLYEPVDLKFAANGDLYFVETGNADVRKITATVGFITSSSGIISLVAGNVAKTSGYATNQGGATPIVVGPGSTASLLDFPASLAFDASGNIYIADEGNEALEAINTSAAAATIQAVTVPAGTISKIAGSGVYQTKSTTGECPNGVYTSSTNRGGCYFGTYSTTSATTAVNALLDAPYAIALDPTGAVYFDNEYIQGVGKIVNGSLTNYAGINGSYALYSASKPLPRAAAGSFAIGSNFGLAVDANSNAYISDALNGVIWRVDGTGQKMYPVAGSFNPNTTIGTPCPSSPGFVATDIYGDGCPATQAIFGKSGTAYSSTGVYGVSVDTYSDLFVGDSVTNLVREVASGTQFGRVGLNVATTDTLDIHYVAGDTPGTYAFNAGNTMFTYGTPACTTNSDNTTDCLLPVTVRPTTLGPFTGTLQVRSGTANGGVATFTLSGIAISVAPVPATRTAVSYTANGPAGCTGGGVYAPGTTVTINAAVLSNGNPTGSVSFYANSTLFGTQMLSSTATATLTAPLAAVGNYTITAVYSGDSFFTTSTGTAAPTITIATPTFSTTIVNDGTTTVHGGCPMGMIGQCVVSAGGSGLYSFTIAQTVYSGTLSFACSGLPANASCVFSPNTITAAGCTTNNTEAVTVLTSQPMPIRTSGVSGFGGRWQMMSMVTGFGLALLVGIRRRRASLRFGQLWMCVALLLAASGLMACGNGTTPSGGTPTGTYTIVVTTTGSGGGTPTTLSFPLTVQ